MKNKFHIREYLSEALLLYGFMLSAGFSATVIEAPGMPIREFISSAIARRALMGLLMGITAVVLLYSPFAKLSGGHMNPAVTFSFYRLGKCSKRDLFWYSIFQCIGGTLGVVTVMLVAGNVFEQPPVSYVQTTPGDLGTSAAFFGEMGISFLLFLMVLYSSNSQRFEKYTGIFAGALLTLFITFEAPLSGMSMNPARTIASAALGGVTTALWIYFVAPPLGMAMASFVYATLHGKHVRCAKLMHFSHRCVFCEHVQQKV